MMDLDATVIKRVDFSAVKIKDLKTRRIFLLADDSRSLRQIFSFAGFDEQSGTAMAELLLKEGYISLNTSGIPHIQTHNDQSGDGFTFTEADIELLVTEVGQYIGPIASVLVQRTVKTGQTFSPAEKEKLFDFFASKIEDEKTRSRFLAEIRLDFS